MVSRHYSSPPVQVAPRHADSNIILCVPSRREAISIEDEEYKLPYDMRLTEAMGLLRYNPAKMLVAFSAYYRDELERKVHYGELNTCPCPAQIAFQQTIRCCG